MKHFISSILFLGIFLSFPVFAAENRTIEITCGRNNISGNLTLETPEDTELIVHLLDKKTNNIVETLDIDLQDDTYLIEISPEAYEIKEHIVKVTATMGEQTAEWSETLMLGSKNCDTTEELEQKIETYATIVEEYVKNNKEIQELPATFLKTGITEYLGSVVAAAGKTFAKSETPVYHDVPARSYTPDEVKYITFPTHYDLLPEAYRGAYAYFRYKGLLIPLQTTNKNMTEEELLDRLHSGGILAPETESLDQLGAIKMIYTHAVSTKKSPFSGVGSHLSVFSEIGDQIKIYVRVPGATSYEEKTYILQKKMEIKPDATEIISSFKKDGADLLAFISCKDGDVLGSTNGREILLFGRKKEEMGDFQTSVIALQDDPILFKVKESLDTYIQKKQLSAEEVRILVTKLELAENYDNLEAAKIATYGKYIISFHNKQNN